MKPATGKTIRCMPATTATGCSGLPAMTSLSAIKAITALPAERTMMKYMPGADGTPYLFEGGFDHDTIRGMAARDKLIFIDMKAISNHDYHACACRYFDFGNKPHPA